MSHLSFYFPSAIPTCCDFSRCNRCPYFFAFMTVLYPYPQESPAWMSFVEMMPGREELIHSSLLVWRTVKLSAVLRTPTTTLKQNLRNKEQKTLLFILIETKTKTFSFGLRREGFFFFFNLRKKRLIFKTQSMVAVKLAWKKLIAFWKQDTNPLNALCFSSNSLGTFPHVGGRFWRVL